MTQFGPEELKAWSRDSFVGNECGSDEYRETQPVKGLGYIARGAEVLSGDRDDGRMTDLIQLTHAWLATRVGLGMGSYAGCDELVPVLSLVHDAMWDYGEHPYYSTLAELEEFKKEVED